LPAITVVFDLDGTIADTAADLIDAANAALVSEGFPQAPAEAIKKAVGQGSKAMIRAGLEASAQKAEPWQVERLSARLVSHYDANIAEKTAFFPGFREVAQELRGLGARLALCTNKREQLTLKLLGALRARELFEAVAGGDTFAFHKPDPRHVTELVRLAGGTLSSAIMAGDSEADIEAAKAAGIPVIAAAFGYAGVPAEALGADAVMHRFEELPGLIGTLLPGARLT
jgi:phosphoglycolate phosphatase